MSDLSELIGRIYESVGDEAALQNVLDEVTVLTRGQGVQFLVEQYLSQAPYPYASAVFPDHLLRERPASDATAFPPIREPKDGPDGGEAGLELVYHLRRAFSLHWQLAGLETTVKSLESTLDRMASSVLLLDRKRALVYANTAGRRLLTEEHLLRIRNGIVAVSSGSDHSTWNLAWERIHAAEKRSTSFALRGTVSRPGAVTLQKVGSQYPLLGFPCADFALFVTAAQRETAADWQSKLGLTAAEAKLAQGLLTGSSPSVLAEAWNVSRETVKTQLAALFRKTNTHRQSQLVALLLRARWRRS